MPPLIRTARAEDAARIGAIARAAYVKYVPRIGREPAPMVADFAAEVAAGHVVVIGTAGALDGYLIGWPETDAHFIDNIAVDPAQQGKGLGRQLIAHAVRSQAPSPVGDPALHQCRDDGEFVHVRPHGPCRNTSCVGEGIRSSLYASGPFGW
jgi:ribosomal protein S18 acetylase RimI-like enzyme